MTARRGWALIAVLLLASCAPPERALLERFFAASRLRDLTALQGISTVVFEPRQHGIVRTFTVAGVGPERLAGGTSVKDVTISAPVVLPDGRTVQKTLVVTLQRPAGASQWVVTAVDER